jgi:hypothetical protein
MLHLFFNIADYYILFLTLSVNDHKLSHNFHINQNHNIHYIYNEFQQLDTYHINHILFHDEYFLEILRFFFTFLIIYIVGVLLREL